MCLNSCTFCYQPCNSCSCRTSCESCNSCSCSECVSAEDLCGCKFTTSTNCVTLKDIDTNCITGLVNGITLTETVNLQNEYICNSITNPSGHLYSTSSCDDNITITTTQVNALHTNYEVCLNEDLVEQIDDNTSAIATLTTCTSGLVGEITTGTPLYLTVTNAGADTPCGRVYNVNFNPSGNLILDGTVYNNLTAATTPTGSGATFIVKSYNRNYVSSSLISNGDKIKLKVTGKIKTSSSSVFDSIIVELYNATSATILSTTTFNQFNSAASGLSSYFIEGDLEVVDQSLGTGLFTITLSANQVDNGTKSTWTKNEGKINEDVSSIDYSNLTIRVKQVNTSVQNATNNACRQLSVEVRKLIS